LALDHPIAVKEAVLPFRRFRTVEGKVVDSVLGPEMRSTGEVMGIDRDFPTAFAKGLLGASVKLPRTGTVFVSVADRDKRAMVLPVKELVDMGFDVVATTGTAAVLSATGSRPRRCTSTSKPMPRTARCSITWLPAPSTWSSTCPPAARNAPTATRFGPRRRRTPCR